MIGNWWETVLSVNLSEQWKTKTKSKRVLVLILLLQCMQLYELLVLGWIWIAWGNCSEAWLHLLWKISSMTPQIFQSLMRRWPYSEWQRGNLSSGIWCWQQQQCESKRCQWQGPALHCGWESSNQWGSIQVNQCSSMLLPGTVWKWNGKNLKFGIWCHGITCCYWCVLYCVALGFGEKQKKGDRKFREVMWSATWWQVCFA